MYEFLCFKGVQSAPGIDLNVTSPNQQQEGLRVKNILDNLQSTHHIPTIVNGGRVTSSVKRKKCFVIPTTQIAYPVVQYQKPPTS
jgi:hypothetical protein